MINTDIKNYFLEGNQGQVLILDIGDKDKGKRIKFKGARMN